MTSTSPRPRDGWIDEARRELRGLRSKDGGWGYRQGSEACVEPTALAALALIASEGGSKSDGFGPWLPESADSVARAQRPGGAIGVSATRPSPGWMTPHALLLWNALGTHRGPASRASAWLLEQSGTTLSRAEDPEGIAGHDTTLVGWPWVSQTHSWLEPTAMAVLALRREGLGDHPRVAEAVRLIRDRAVEGGGWNYGNKAVFGHPLRAQPAPTGLALLALSGIGPRTGTIDRAVRYLRESLPGVRAPVSLGWGIIGLTAWGERPGDSEAWLAESHASVSGKADSALKIACLLLASSAETPGLLGGELPRARIT